MFMSFDFLSQILINCNKSCWRELWVTSIMRVRGKKLILKWPRVLSKRGARKENLYL